MSKVLIIFLLVVSFSCIRSKTESYNKVVRIEQNIPIFKDRFDSLQGKFDQNTLQEMLDEGWLEENKDVILLKNPDFDVRYFDSAKFLFIPSLIIPKDVIEDGNANLGIYMAQGKLSIKESRIFVIKDSVLLSTLTWGRLGITPQLVSTALHKARIGELNSADFFFKLNFAGKNSYSPMPGIIYFKDSEFFVLSEYGDIYPLNQIHKLLWETPKHFQKHLNAIKRLN